MDLPQCQEVLTCLSTCATDDAECPFICGMGSEAGQCFIIQNICIYVIKRSKVALFEKISKKYILEYFKWGNSKPLLKVYKEIRIIFFTARF